MPRRPVSLLQHEVVTTRWPLLFTSTAQWTIPTVSGMTENGPKHCLLSRLGVRRLALHGLFRGAQVHHEVAANLLQALFQV